MRYFHLHGRVWRAEDIVDVHKTILGNSFYGIKYTTKDGRGGEALFETEAERDQVFENLYIDESEVG